MTITINLLSNLNVDLTPLIIIWLFYQMTLCTQKPVRR